MSCLIFTNKYLYLKINLFIAQEKKDKQKPFLQKIGGNEESSTLMYYVITN